MARRKGQKPEDLGNFACNGCGSCCEKFTLCYSPDELKELYRSWKSGSNTAVKMNGDVQYRNAVEDIDLVYPMVRFLSKKHIDGYRDSYIYTCIHYDKKNKKCGIHDIRPRMCRAFPFYGHETLGQVALEEYPKCQFYGLWKKQKDKKQKKQSGKRKGKIKILLDNKTQCKLES